MLVFDLARIAVDALLVKAGLNRTPRYLRRLGLRYCPQCRGRDSHTCLACNGAGLTLHRGRTRPDGNA